MSESTMTTNSNFILFKHKWFLYSTEFFSGMSVMAGELGASRLIAPYFSSSQIVWTIIIGTIMIAMALGNVFGGRWADHEDNPGKLFRRILIAAIWIALIPVFGKYCILLVTGTMILTINTNLLVFAHLRYHSYGRDSDDLSSIFGDPVVPVAALFLYDSFR